MLHKSYILQKKCDNIEDGYDRTVIQNIIQDMSFWVSIDPLLKYTNGTEIWVFYCKILVIQFALKYQ